jgi:hypothetical protein
LGTFRKASVREAQDKKKAILSTPSGGYIAVKPVNVEVVSNMLNAFVASDKRKAYR